MPAVCKNASADLQMAKSALKRSEDSRPATGNNKSTEQNMTDLEFTPGVVKHEAINDEQISDYFMSMIEEEPCRSFARVLSEQDGKYTLVIIHIHDGEVCRLENYYSLHSLFVDYFVAMERLKKRYAL